MKRWLQILCGAGAAALLCQYNAQARDFVTFPNGPAVGGHEAPAQRLENVRGNASALTVTRAGGGVAHILPTPQFLAQIRRISGPSPFQPLLYHAGGSVMLPFVAVYIIYWAPATLQDGHSTGFSSQYGVVNTLLGAWYNGHGLGSNNTQYYQTISNTTTYFQNNGGLGGTYIDTSPYPASGCSDAVTPNDCITDAQLQAEITTDIGLAHWPSGGLNNLFLVFTSSGEGSCFDSTNSTCAYTQYCAYHSYLSNGSSPIIYGNIPYGGVTSAFGSCLVPGQTSPNSDAAADGAANTASHEMTEAMTDPLLDAWFDGAGNEIGDLCNFTFGTNTWDSGLANQMWNGEFFELQEEYDNHAGACVQAGP